jgi:uncharacterized coiled-coil protein SlyX
LEVDIVNKSDLERRFKDLEAQLNIQTVRKEKQTKLIKSLSIELGRINDKIDEMSKEIISVVESLRKFKE